MVSFQLEETADGCDFSIELSKDRQFSGVFQL